MSVVTMTLQGTRTMLQHNGRLASPIDPLTRELKTLTGKQKKTVADYQAMLTLEGYASCWETDHGVLGLPTENVWKAIHTAATLSRRGEDLKRALSFLPGAVAPLLVAGAAVDAKAYVESGSGIFIRTVVVKRCRTLRARVQVPAGWSSTHVFELLDDVMDYDVLTPLVFTAGRLVGVGDWRPLYGRFDVTMRVDERPAQKTKTRAKQRAAA